MLRLYMKPRKRRHERRPNLRRPMRCILNNTVTLERVSKTAVFTVRAVYDGVKEFESAPSAIRNRADQQFGTSLARYPYQSTLLEPWVQSGHIGNKDYRRHR